MAVPALASVGLVAAWAHAGLKSNVEVTISTASRYAYGSLGSARASAGGSQRLGCSVYATSGATNVLCSAVNAAGTYVSCSSTSARHVAVVQGLNGDSYLYFDWDTDGKCDEIGVLNHSYFAPKTL